MGQSLPAPQTVSPTPTIVLLHGWAMHAAAWGGLPARLAGDFPISTPDLPGHGDNDSAAPSSLDALADDLAPQVPPGALVVGWSLGAQLALRLVLGSQVSVSALVLIGATPRFVGAEDWSHGMPPARFETFYDQVATNPATTIDRFVALAGLGSRKPKAMAQLLGELLGQRPAARQPALTAGLEILRDTDLRAELASVAVPTWVIHGEGDAIVPVAAGRWLAETIPGAQFIPLAAGHAPFLDHTDAITRLIRNTAFGQSRQP